MPNPPPSHAVMTFDRLTAWAETAAKLGELEAAQTMLAIGGVLERSTPIAVSRLLNFLLLAQPRDAQRLVDRGEVPEPWGLVAAAANGTVDALTDVKHWVETSGLLDPVSGNMLLGSVLECQSNFSDADAAWARLPFIPLHVDGNMRTQMRIHLAKIGTAKQSNKREECDFASARLLANIHPIHRDDRHVLRIHRELDRRGLQREADYIVSTVMAVEAGTDRIHAIMPDRKAVEKSKRTRRKSYKFDRAALGGKPLRCACETGAVIVDGLAEQYFETFLTPVPLLGDAEMIKALHPKESPVTTMLGVCPNCGAGWVGWRIPLNTGMVAVAAG